MLFARALKLRYNSKLNREGPAASGLGRLRSVAHTRLVQGCASVLLAHRWRCSCTPPQISMFPTHVMHAYKSGGGVTAPHPQLRAHAFATLIRQQDAAPLPDKQQASVERRNGYRSRG